MILAEASTALNISITLLIIVHVVVSLFMILVVMMQRPKQEGLGAAFGGGMTDQLLGAGTTSFLQKATVTLGILFFLISLILAILIGRANRVEGLTTQDTPASELQAAPAAPGDISLPVDDGEEEELLQALEAGLSNTEVNEVEGVELETNEDAGEAAEPEASDAAPAAEVEATEPAAEEQ